MKKNKYLSDLWNQTKFNFVFVIASISILLFMISMYSISIFGILGLLFLFQTIRVFIVGGYNFYQYLRSLVVIAIFVAVFYYVPKYFGYWSLAVLILLFLVYKMWVGRAIMMSSIRYIESVLFGKSLDKENWRKDKPSIYKKEGK